MKHIKLLSGLLASASIIQTVAPTVITAKEISVKPETINETVLPKNKTKMPEIKMPETKIPKLETINSEKDEFVESEVYVSAIHTLYFNDLDSMLFKNAAVNKVPIGTQVKAVDREVKDNVTYLLLNNLGLDLGWVTEDSVKYIPKSEITKTVNVDDTVQYGTIKEKVMGNTKPKNIKDSKRSDYSLEKDSNVAVLEEITLKQEKTYDTWYQYKTADFSGWVNLKDVKDVKIVVDTVVEGLSKVDTLNVYEKPTYTSKVVQTVTEAMDKKLDLFGVETEEIADLESTWLKVIPLDDKDDTLSDKEPTYVLKESVEMKNYAQLEKEEFLDTTAYYRVKSDANVWNKPSGLKGDILTDVKIESDDIVFVNKKVSVKSDEGTKDWYSVVKDEKIIGFVPSETLVSIEKDTDVYYTVEHDTNIDELVADLKLDMKEFYYMNLDLTEDEIEEGTSIKIQGKEQTYDTTYATVKSTNATKLINEMIPSIQYIKSKGLKPSVAFAQAIHESGNGTSDLARLSNNLFGIKGTYNGEGSSWNTQENYGGSNVTIKATFKAYPSKVESIMDYVDLISTRSRYSGAVNADSPLDAIISIKNGGYATDPEYVSKIMNTIVKYDLTQFDL